MLHTIAVRLSVRSVEKQSRRGLTLIELLVVIGILALLAAILFPVFGRVRETSRRSSCQSNLRQLAAGLLQYVRDFDDRLPHSAQGSDGVEGGWVPGGGGAPYPTPARVEQGALFPYVKSSQIYMCISDTNAKVKGLSYSMNMLASRQKLSTCYKTSQTALLLDESATLNDGNFNPKPCGGNDVPSSIHLGSSNIVFMDGHAKAINVDQLEKKDYRYTGVDCP